MALGESEQRQWIASAMSQQLEMSNDALCFDYHLAEPAGVWNVTAAQQHDVARFRHLARHLRLQVTAITPDACALRAFLPLCNAPDAVVVWRDGAQWLWASRLGWGHVLHSDAPTLALLGERLNVALSQVVCCTSLNCEGQSVDPWNAIVQKQPPLPASGDDFSVAIALAMGGNNDESSR